MIPQRITFSPDELEARRRRLLPNARREFARDPRNRRYYYIHPQQDRRVYMRSPHTNILAARRGQTDNQFRASLRGFHRRLENRGLRHIRQRIDDYLGYGYNPYTFNEVID